MLSQDSGASKVKDVVARARAQAERMNNPVRTRNDAPTDGSVDWLAVLMTEDTQERTGVAYLPAEKRAALREWLGIIVEAISRSGPTQSTRPPAVSLGKRFVLESVRRIDSNLYRSGDMFIETRYCYHYAYGETAILKYEGPSEYSGSKILWDDDSPCDVKAVMKEISK